MWVWTVWPWQRSLRQHGGKLQMPLSSGLQTHGAARPAQVHRWVGRLGSSWVSGSRRMLYCCCPFWCADLNECSKQDICGVGGQCVNQPGSYKCECHSGFRIKSHRHFVCEGTNPQAVAAWGELQASARVLLIDFRRKWVFKSRHLPRWAVWEHRGLLRVCALPAWSRGPGGHLLWWEDRKLVSIGHLRPTLPRLQQTRFDRLHQISTSVWNPACVPTAAARISPALTAACATRDSSHPQTAKAAAVSVSQGLMSDFKASF